MSKSYASMQVSFTTPWNRINLRVEVKSVITSFQDNNEQTRAFINLEDTLERVGLKEQESQIWAQVERISDSIQYNSLLADTIND